jgi:hypothetical protein
VSVWKKIKCKYFYKHRNNLLVSYVGTLINLASFGIPLPITILEVVCLKGQEIFTKKPFRQLLQYEISHR